MQGSAIEHKPNGFVAALSDDGGATNFTAKKFVGPAAALLSMAIPLGSMPIRPGAFIGLCLLLGGALRQNYWAVRRVFLYSGLALVGGLITGLLGRLTTDRPYGLNQSLHLIFALAGFVGIIALLVWCKSRIGWIWTTTFFCLAIGLSPLGSHSLIAANYWKFGLAWPVTVALLAAAGATKKMWVAVVVLVFSGFLNAANDFRSMLLVVAVAILACVLPNGGRLINARQAKILRVSLMVAALIWASTFGVQVAVSGRLGESIAEKTAWQLSHGGNLLVVARAEYPTSVGFFLHNPLGYGIGALPTYEDYEMSRARTVAAGGYPDAAPLATFSVQTIRLHSQIADLWFFFGIAALPLVWLMLKTFAIRLIEPAVGDRFAPLMYFVSAAALWDLFFSPFEGNNYFYSAFALALVLTRIHKGRDRVIDRAGTSSGVEAIRQ